MTRALVLGGGGPVGIGWEAGLIVGLARRGVDLDRADAIVGTSAGSVVGFTLASGGDLSQATSLVHSANQTVAADPAAAGAVQGLEQLLATVAEAATEPAQAEAIRARLGQLALGARTISEEIWLDMFADFAGAEWPATFTCTAVEVTGGRFRLWEAADGVDVQRAVASSCAVPCIFPPVEIQGARYMDGGVRDMLNADVAAGHDTVIVMSCTLLELPPGFADPMLESLFGPTRAALDGLRDGGAKVEVVIPGAEMLEISGFGMNLMDFTKAGAAYEAGLRQAEEEAGRLGGVWSA
jgi:NTE family protein